MVHNGKTRVHPREPLQALENEVKESSRQDELDAYNTSLYWSAAARLNCWTVDMPDIQKWCESVLHVHMSMKAPGANDWQRFMRVAWYVKVGRDTEIKFS